MAKEEIYRQECTRACIISACMYCLTRSCLLLGERATALRPPVDWVALGGESSEGLLMKLKTLLLTLLRSKVVEKGKGRRERGWLIEGWRGMEGRKGRWSREEGGDKERRKSEREEGT